MGPSGMSAPAGGGVQGGADPAVVGGVEGDAWRHDGVDSVEDVIAQVHLRDGELRLEVVHRAGADDRRGDSRVAQNERDGQLDEADTGLVGETGEGLGGVELALVIREGQVEPVGQAGAGRGGRAACSSLRYQPRYAPRRAGRASGGRRSRDHLLAIGGRCQPGHPPDAQHVARRGEKERQQQPGDHRSPPDPGAVPRGL